MIVRDFTRVKVGTDSSGRPILMTKYMHSVWQTILADHRVAPFAHKLTIVQGAFMALVGGGAKESAGYHDQGGCIDVRTWNLTDAELETFIRVARMNGWAFWRRDRLAAHGGMDPHAHGVLGTDKPLSAGAASQWVEYLNGGDGITGDRRDYEWRPAPLVTKPPTTTTQIIEDEDDMTPEQMLKAKLDSTGHTTEYTLAQTYFRTKAIEKALAVLAAGISPTVEAAVKEALAESVVSVDVKVNGVPQ